MLFYTNYLKEYTDKQINRTTIDGISKVAKYKVKIYNQFYSIE
jgi:hypothetical protein